MSENRLLILLNPGRQSRHYMLGLAAAAHRMDVPFACVEMAALWQRSNLAGGSAEERARLQVEMARLVRHHRITHVIGYAWNSVLDFGLMGTRRGEPGAPLFAALGVHNILLWTDHPNWFSQGEPLRSELTRLLAHPMHTHIVKSYAAAAEATGLLRWPNIHAMAMAEDYDELRLRAERGPMHDVVAVVGETYPLPSEVEPFVDDDSPEPDDIDTTMRRRVQASWDRWVSAQDVPVGMGSSLRAAGRALMDARVAQPSVSFWSLAVRRGDEHTHAIAWLQGRAERWYAAAELLRRLVDWRRGFYLKWLSRRVDVGVYGASAAPLGIAQPSGADRWVEYVDQATVYARGRTALNINAAHDEEGCSHKPFQIAASGTACVHHQTRGLGELFEVGREIEEFSRPVELLEQVRSLAADERRRHEMGEAMLARARREHTWDARLATMLELAGVVRPAEGTLAAAA